MPKRAKNQKQTAALHREASKRGESTPPITGAAISVSSDDEYEPSDRESEDDPPHTPPIFPLFIKSSAPKPPGQPVSKKPIPRNTAWRMKKREQEKERIAAMQKSAADIFEKKPFKMKIKEAQAKADAKRQRAENEIIEIHSSGSETSESVSIVEVVQHTDKNSVPLATFNVVDSTVDLESNTELAAEARNERPPASAMDVDEDTEWSLGSPMQIDMELTEDEFAMDIGLTDDELEPLFANDDSQEVDQAPPRTAAVLDQESLESVSHAKHQHDQVRKLLLRQEKILRNANALASSRSAVKVAYFDIEVVRKYNNRRFELYNQRERIRQQIKSSNRLVRHRLKERMSRIHPAKDAARMVSNECGKGTTFMVTLRSMWNRLLKVGELAQSNQGKGAYHETHLSNPSVRSALERWVKGLIDPEKGGYTGHLRPSKLRRYVNEYLFPDLKINDTISESTGVRWLRKLGFNHSRVQKGVYVDGHERPDVVEARKKFIDYMYKEIIPLAYEYEGDDLRELAPPRWFSGSGKIHYPIFHDETCIHANDLSSHVWMREGEQPLRNKSRGRIVHVSDFIIEHCGRLSLSPSEIEAQMRLPVAPLPPGEDTEAQNVPTKSSKKKGTQQASPAAGRSLAEHENVWVPPPPPNGFPSYRLSTFDARKIIYPGANHDPWWDMAQLITQTKDAIRIFDTKYPNGIAVFIFDCSSAHEAFASDALLAHKMNRGSGGKQPIMHDTYIPATGEPQSMVFPPDYQGKDKDGLSLAGRPKGMETVLRERGLLQSLQQRHGNKLVAVCADCKRSQSARDAAAREARAKRDEIEGSGVDGTSIRGVSDVDELDANRAQDCCMQRVLSLQDDFRNEKPLLQLIIEQAGHKCLFLPKFHCELNPIEMVWGHAKRAFREKADGTFKTAKELVPECLDSVTVSNIRRYFRHCYRYMDAYRIGLNVRQAAYAVKKYSSHRRIPLSIRLDINILIRR